MFQRLRTKEAIEIYKNYLDENPTSSRVAFILAQALKENGEYQSAFNYLRQSLQSLPGDRTVSEFSRNFIQTQIPEMMHELKSRMG